MRIQNFEWVLMIFMDCSVKNPNPQSIKVIKTHSKSIPKTSKNHPKNTQKSMHSKSRGLDPSRNHPCIQPPVLLGFRGRRAGSERHGCSQAGGGQLETGHISCSLFSGGPRKLWHLMVDLCGFLCWVFGMIEWWIWWFEEVFFFFDFVRFHRDEEGFKMI